MRIGSNGFLDCHIHNVQSVWTKHPEMAPRKKCKTALPRFGVVDGVSCLVQGCAIGQVPHTPRRSRKELVAVASLIHAQTESRCTYTTSSKNNPCRQVVKEKIQTHMVPSSPYMTRLKARD